MPLLILMGAAVAGGCPPPEVVAAEARELILDARPEVALQQIRGAEDLSCLEVLLGSPEALAALFQIGGIAAIEAGDEALARRWFGDAARLAWTVPLDARLSQGGALFAQVHEATLSRPRGTVMARSEVRLDGWSLSVGDSRAVPPGWHLVQSITPEGAVESLRVEVASGARVEVGRPASSMDIVAPPSPRRGLGVAGAALVVAGATSLALSASAAHDLGVAKAQGAAVDAQRPLAARTNALLYGGVGVVGVGATGLVVALFFTK